MFAQNKEDKKRVESALTDSGLSCCKLLPKVIWAVERESSFTNLRASVRWQKDRQQSEGLTLAQFTFEAFLTFYKNLTGRKEVEQIFQKLCGGNKYLGVPAFVQFLNQTQRDPRLNEILHPYANPENALDCMKQHEPDANNAKNGQLSLAGFLSYLMSDSNYIVNTSKLECSDSMDQPLAHYFINSSHNTYLTGHQITGKSSVEIYRQCLLSGCRCIELDLWNGTKEEPVVVHGYTFVPEISAKEVIEAIAESAFKTSEYPVVLSFENHCNPKQQAKIASYCREIFGDMLLDSPLPSHKLEVGAELPPPSLLKNKIIIKNKKKHHHHHHKKSHNAAAVSDAAQGAAEDADGAIEGNGDVPQGHPPLSARQASKESADGDDDGDDDEESSSRDEDDADVPEDGKEKNPDKAAALEEEAVAEISALVNYVQPVHFLSFESAEKRRRYYEMSSFDEKQATTLLKERPIEFVNYNKQQLSRVYPAGTRFDSSNLMPQIFWNAGCQLVALNYQTLDLSMQLNLGLFEYNNRCGFLLKPEFMRRNDKSFDPFAESPVDGIIAGTVSVQVLSGQFLTDKRVGTYVEVEMYGLPADTVRKRFRTKVVPNNGINPFYEDEPFVFKKVVLPEIASIRLVAYEDSGKFIGHRVLPVVGLCPGYRHVGLRNEANQPLPMAQLFLMIVVKDYVPHGMSDLADALSNPIEYHSKKAKREVQLSVLTDGTGVDDHVQEDEKKEKDAVKEGTNAESENVNGSKVADVAASAADVDCRPETSAPGGVEKLLATKRPSTALIASNVSGAVVSAEASGATGGLVQSTSGDLGDDIRAESLEKLMENKAVREKKAEMDKKLEALRKKNEKERVRLQMHKGSQDSEKSRTKFYMSNKLVKRLSSKNMHALFDSSAGAPELATQHEAPEEREDGVRSGIPRSQSERLLTVWKDQIKQEKELHRKYHELLFATIDKTMRASQSLQMKELKAKLDRKTEEVMRALQADRRKGIKELAKKHKDRDELIRIKREVASAMVEKGVTERVRLGEVYEMKKSDLEKQHESVRESLKQKKAEAEKVLEQEYEQRIATLEEEVQPGNGGDSQDTD